MRILIIKTSSLGDVINTLPALTDAANNISDIQFDWVVEPAFAEVPGFHPNVRKVIPFDFRKMRKNIIQNFLNHHWQNFFHDLRHEKYDYVIDAQGLIKSGLLSYFSRGPTCGYDKHSAWEPIACLFYDKRFDVKPEQHAIVRIRQLFAKSLNYPIPNSQPDSNISKISLDTSLPRNDKYLMFFHGTAREEKLWPEDHWKELIQLLKDSGYKILLPWGNQTEKDRADRLALNQNHVEVLPKLSLTELAMLLKYSSGNVAVDTGLGHLAAALNSPTISLYGPTKPELNGTIGGKQLHIKVQSLDQYSAKDAKNALQSLEHH